MTTVWTVQAAEVLDELDDLGVIRVHPEHADPDFAEAYQWLHQQMISRGLMGQDDWPLWGWADIEQGDLALHLEDARDAEVAIRVEVPEERLLLSDYDAWHDVLNHHPCLDHAEREDFLARADHAIGGTWHRQPLPQPMEDELIASWDNVFDLNLRGGRDCA